MTRAIIAGVDGSAPSLQAVRWAAEEAVIRGAPLRLVHATSRWTYDVPLIPQPPSWTVDAEAAVGEMLRQAAQEARAGRPKLEVTTEILDGGAQDALVAAAEGAELIVVGSRGRGGFAELLLGSVSRHVAARSPCPVAVIRRSPAGDRGEIAVGIAEGRGQERLLDFSFREAALRRATLRAVHAWVHPATRAPGDMQPLVYDVEGIGQEEARLLAEAVAGWREKFPDVTVSEQVVHEHAAKALVEASREVDLVIVGAHGGILDLGGTVHAVLHHASAAVIVVRP
ncbi:MULTISPECIES: universal stress protein [Nonomuraea]|uniref:Universal stress protein n=1 Tax=Nonomuraea mangrovi TaxID=2316207 RepID=A0ABW4SL63_9ACTN